MGSLSLLCLLLREPPLGTKPTTTIIIIIWVCRKDVCIILELMRAMARYQLHKKVEIMVVYLKMRIANFHRTINQANEYSNVNMSPPPNEYGVVNVTKVAAYDS